MDVLYLKAIVSGICFGLWPLFMNKSGLNSAEASAALSLFLLAVVSPFLLVNGIPQFSAVKAVPACVFDALGLLALNSLLASASSVQAGSAFVIVTVVQVASGRVLGRVGRRIDAKVCDWFGCRSNSVYLLR
jgi:hypothetical protein